MVPVEESPRKRTSPRYHQEEDVKQMKQSLEKYQFDDVSGMCGVI